MLHKIPQTINTTCQETSLHNTIAHKIAFALKALKKLISVSNEIISYCCLLLKSCFIGASIMSLLSYCLIVSCTADYVDLSINHVLHKINLIRHLSHNLCSYTRQFKKRIGLTSSSIFVNKL